MARTDCASDRSTDCNRWCCSVPPSCARQFEIGRRSPSRLQLPHGAGGALEHQIGANTISTRAGVAVGESRRPGRGASGDQGRDRTAAFASRSFRKISARDAERFSALRSAGLRQDAHRQSDRVQSDQAAPRKNAGRDEGIFHARQRARDPQHVGRRIGADRARNFRHRARKTKEGFLPFLFIDEAESILGTRRASRYSNILSTLVPMFCSEMDGIDSLNDVVIILASNRADLIDPAILRRAGSTGKSRSTVPTRKARAKFTASI